jgi:hypothetical protein
MMLLRLLALLVGIYATDATAAMCDVRTAAPTVADLTSMGLLSCDTSSNLRVTLGTLLAGEDQTNNVLKVEGQFSYKAPVVADAQVKASAGFLHCIWITQNDAAPTAGTIIIYDNTAESGTQVFNWTLTTAVFTPIVLCPDIVMATGIYIGFTTTADVNVSVSYR